MDDGRWTPEPGSRLPGLDVCHAVLQRGHPLLHLPDPLLQLGVGDADHRAQLPFHALHADEDPFLALSEALVPINKSLVPLREELHLASEVLPHDIEVATGFGLLRSQFFFRRGLVESPVDPLELPPEEFRQLVVFAVGHGIPSPVFGRGVRL